MSEQHIWILSACWRDWAQTECSSLTVIARVLLIFCLVYSGSEDCHSSCGSCQRSSCTMKFHRLVSCALKEFYLSLTLSHRWISQTGGAHWETLTRATQVRQQMKSGGISIRYKISFSGIREAVHWILTMIHSSSVHPQSNLDHVLNNTLYNVSLTQQ